MSVFDTENLTTEAIEILLDDVILNNPMYTDDLLEQVNRKAVCYEDIFNNSVTHAFYQEDLTQRTLLHKTAEKLYEALRKGYSLNLCHDDFIKHITMLFQYGTGEIFTKLFNELPDALKLFVAYYKTSQNPVHFWFQSLMSELSVTDLLNCFNVPLSNPRNIEQDRLALEPYLIALDASLQKFDFDTGHEQKIDLLIHTLKLRSIYNYLNSNQILSPSTIKQISETFPEKYQFLIESALSIDCGCFLNGLVILSEMVFGGPSESFIKKITKLLLETQAYTIPFSNHGVPLPVCLPFPHPQKIFFYKPFVLSKDKNGLSQRKIH